jgi:hypothetical protein
VKPAIVGFNVGFYVGKSSRPDMVGLKRISSLHPDCRKCRVAVEQETHREFQTRRFRHSEPIKYFSALDLNDAGNRR